MVFFGAMAYGAPVLAHDLSASRESLTRGAVVVPRFGPQEAGAQPVRLVNDNDQRRKLGREA